MISITNTYISSYYANSP